MNYNNKLKTNNENLLTILNTINSLPQIPQLINPALEPDILLGKEAIINGEKIVGNIETYNGEFSENIISVIPAEYARLNYIEFNGSQYIDTGFKASTTNTKYETKISLNSITTTQALFGSRNTYNVSDANNCVVFVINKNLRLDWVNGNGSSGLNHPAEIDTLYNISITRGTALINGMLYTSNETSSIEQKYNFFIGNIANGGASTYTTGFIGRLYSSKLYNKNTLVREFVPCKRLSDNVIGLYEIVEGSFYTNKGTGNFVGG